MADHNALTEEKRAIKLNFKAKVKDMQKVSSDLRNYHRC